MSDLVFLDTETTGLSLNDDIWEFAAIRRTPDGTETALHLFLKHSAVKCANLPESFRVDHERRFPAMTHKGEWHPDVVSQSDAAGQIDDFLQGKPHIVGAVPNFDMERIALMCQAWFEEWRAPWHYHLIDVENLAVGWLTRSAHVIYARSEGDDAVVAEAQRLRDVASPPWNSDELSAALGITVPEDERHTAMGDVRWAMRIYDAIMGDPR